MSKTNVVAASILGASMVVTSLVVVFGARSALRESSEQTQDNINLTFDRAESLYETLEARGDVDRVERTSENLKCAAEALERSTSGLDDESKNHLVRALGF